MYAGLDNSFIKLASDILADTNTGLTGNNIVEYCNSFALDYGKNIPHACYPFIVANKRTALYENLQCFNSVEQFDIISSLCDLPLFKNNQDVKELRMKLYSKYGNYAVDVVGNNPLIQVTKKRLANYPTALKSYESGIAKDQGGVFLRNALDDMRLSLELLVKDIFGNSKSLENQRSDLGKFLKSEGISKEIRNLFMGVMSDYEKFQNQHVKHDDRVNSKEIEFIIELTSIIMNFLIELQEE
jgi:hypothetical protein